MIIAIVIFTAIMGAGAWNAITRGGEKEGICKYGYKEEDEQ
jgi:hypothetical protein